MMSPSYDTSLIFCIGFKYMHLCFRCPDSLPSFTEAAESFNSVANKAENTMKEVNDWLKNRERTR